jgi:hypothetical protein
MPMPVSDTANSIQLRPSRTLRARSVGAEAQPCKAILHLASDLAGVRTGSARSNAVAPAGLVTILAAKSWAIA